MNLIMQYAPLWLPLLYLSLAMLVAIIIGLACSPRIRRDFLEDWRDRK